MDNKLIVREKENSLIVEARVDFIADYILNNPKFLRKKKCAELSYSLIEEVKNKFGVEVSLRTIENYIKKARTLIRKTTNVKLEQSLKRQKEYLLSLLQRCWAEGDMRLEHAVLKDIAVLEGLYFETNRNAENELVIKNVNPTGLTMRQLERIEAGENIAHVILTPDLQHYQKKWSELQTAASLELREKKKEINNLSSQKLLGNE